ncbi:puromycin-sensitive aminopeptidase-like isoform X2 [Ornithodoros turicata]|uniref:puromycin-sensitive aminopeptidase-like isoform X2 n=1 Tax=Ornithodoros turicata TaxID=34597 RepID=UPI003139E435
MLSLTHGLRSFRRSLHLQTTSFSFSTKPQQHRTMSAGPVFERLPKNVVPLNYKLEIKPDLKNFVFDGKSVVQVRVVQPTSKVTLNSLDIDIKSAEYVSSSGSVHKAGNISLSKIDERAELSFDTELLPGDGLLKMTFTGELNENLKGLYRVKYKGTNGEEKYGAVTQFESSDARRAFPCWDEPAIKATFDVTLVVPKDLVALSNCNVVSDQLLSPENTHREVKFATTPIMSTYLVAMVIGEYDYVEGKSASGVCVRVYTPVGKKEQGVFALEVAAKALSFYEDYFNVPYPLPKLDLVAAAELAAGAMENWGLVIYREVYLLYDHQNSSARSKQYVAIVVAHELAHQWFGDLVTMEWWTDLWLNEGFATFMEFLCVDHIFPEFEVWTQFVTDCYAMALELDALDNSHPIEVPVGNPQEIDEIFDDISYKKGASVIRMLHAYIGDENFKKGMSLYLTKHKYKNTVTKDLWKSLADACHMPVEEVMSTWIKQKGYPVISVSGKQDGSCRQVTFSQEKFCAGGKAEGDTSLWMVPVSICTAKDSSTIAKKFLLDSRSSEIQVKDVAPDEWIKVNVGMKAFYRTLYSEEMLDRLIPAIKDKVLPPLDRLGLQSDLFALVRSGHKSTVEALKLMEAFVNEDNCNVWCSISSCLGNLNQLLLHTDLQPLLHAYGCKLFSTIFAKVGWDAKPNEGHLQTLLRSIVIQRLCRFKDEKVLHEAKRRFDAHIEGTTTIPADLRGSVYLGVAATADKATYNKMLELYRKVDLQEEKIRIACAMATASDPELIKATLDFAISDEVRLQDCVFVIGSCTRSKEGLHMSWKFLQDNKDLLTARFDGGFLLCSLVKDLTENFASEEKALEVEEFFRQNHFPATERTVQRSLENIRLNAKWLQRDASKIKEYFLHH